MAKMTDDALLSLVEQRINASVNYIDTTFSLQRTEALQFYRGEPMGDEEAGLSQVVSRDFMESVEGSMPGLMRPFVSADEVVQFEPQGEEDEAIAKQVTAYMNYLFTRRNDAFRFIYDTMKDGLMFRLGVAKVVREEYTDESTTTYTGLDQDSLQALALDPAIEVTAVYDDPDAPGMAAAETKTTKTKGRICFIPVANDEFLFERQLAKLADATFVAHRARKTVADLIDMGLDRKKCLAIPTGDQAAYTLERVERFNDQALVFGGGDESSDPMMRHVWTTECFIRCDYKGSERETEWRRVIVANSTLLLNEAADGHPFAVWTPIPIPHRLAGLSYFDITRDIQIIKTQLQREQMNNVYLTNRPQREVLDGQVNVDDLLSPRVGGIIRVKQIGAIKESVVPFTAGESGQLIEYFDSVREQRTGVTRYNQGMDANSLNKTATGINIIANASQQRMELVSRQYAEFLKDIFRIALKLVCKYPDDAEVMRLTNKEPVKLDPREWSDEYDMTVTVGLGTGDKQQQVGMLTNLLGIQREIIQFQGGANGPLVGLPNLHETISRLIEAMGLKGADKYIMDPAKAQEQPQQQGPDPQQQAQAQQMQAQQAETQAKMESEERGRQVEIAKAHLMAQTAIEVARIRAESAVIVAGMRVPPELMAPIGDGDGQDDETAPQDAMQDAGQMAPEAMPEPQGAPMGGQVTPDMMAALQAHFGGQPADDTGALEGGL